jgi:hypothetical protein
MAGHRVERGCVLTAHAVEGMAVGAAFALEELCAFIRIAVTARLGPPTCPEGTDVSISVAVAPLDDALAISCPTNQPIRPAPATTASATRTRIALKTAGEDSLLTRPSSGSVRATSGTRPRRWSVHREHAHHFPIPLAVQSVVNAGRPRPCRPRVPRQPAAGDPLGVAAVNQEHPSLLCRSPYFPPEPLRVSTDGRGALLAHDGRQPASGRKVGK